jgi:hypothetical protein
MYAVQWLNNSKELYDMVTDPVQMNNLHPDAPSNPGVLNSFDSDNTKHLGFLIPQLLWRLDMLLLVLKSCKAKDCRHLWQHLHPKAQVKNLKEAMHNRFDDLYRGLPRVHHNRCFKDGVISLHAEGPQWSSRLLHHHDGDPHTAYDDMDSEDDSSVPNDWTEARIYNDQQVLGYESDGADEEVDNSDFDWDSHLLNDWE